MARAAAGALVKKLTSSLTHHKAGSSEDAMALKDRGVQHFNEGNLVAAGTCFRRAISLQPNLADAHNNLGAVLRKWGRPQSAIASFQTSLLLNPRSASAYGNLGNLHERYGNLAQAETFYLKAVEIEPRLHQAFIGLARIATHRKRWDDALASLTRAASIAPQDPSIFHQTGVIYLGKGDLDAALTALRNASGLAPNVPAIKASLAEVLVRLEKNKDARVEAEACLALEPDNAIARAVLDRLNTQSGASPT